MKRAFDVVGSCVGLLVMSPVMAVIALLVRRDSPGPVLFRQDRVGATGRPFTLLKFRSMNSDRATPGPKITTSHDPRVTRIGARLRATKLDELPQLINVVRGDMSLVGPRPELAEYVALWSDDDRKAILSVRPGITDPATLQLRREEELLAMQPNPEAFYEHVLLPRKVLIYRNYVEHQSFGMDLKLILLTIVSVVRD